MLFLRLLIAFEHQIDRRRMREFRRASEAPILDIELLRDRLNLCAYDFGVERRSRPGEDFGLRTRLAQRIGGAFEIGTLVFVRVGDGTKHALESRPAELVVGRKIRSAEKRFS